MRSAPYRAKSFELLQNSLQGSHTSVTYDEEKCILHLRFGSGDVYRYFELFNDGFRQFLSAESKGRYFLSNIRTCFRYEGMAKLRAA